MSKRPFHPGLAVVTGAGSGLLTRPGTTARAAAIVNRIGSKDVGNPAETPDVATVLGVGSARRAKARS